eukprot:jgi/Ulvmu1/12283/UM087_0017.1
MFAGCAYDSHLEEYGKLTSVALLPWRVATRSFDRVPGKCVVCNSICIYHMLHRAGMAASMGQLLPHYRDRASCCIIPDAFLRPALSCQRPAEPNMPSSLDGSLSTVSVTVSPSTLAPMASMQPLSTAKLAS